MPKKPEGLAQPMASLEPEHFKSPVKKRIRETHKSSLAKALALSLLLNFGPLYGVKEKNRIQEGLKQGKDYLATRINQLLENTELETLKESLIQTIIEMDKKGKLGTISQRKFNIEADRAAGMSAEACEEGDAAFQTQIDEYLHMVEEGERTDVVLHETLQDQGGYEPFQARFTGLMADKAGNCEARAKRELSVLQELYPVLETKIQVYGSDEINDPHIRVIVKLGSKWFALEQPTLEELTPENARDTAIFDNDFFLRAYAGLPMKPIILFGSKSAREANQKDAKSVKAPFGTNSTLDLSKYITQPLRVYHGDASSSRKAVRYTYEETHPEAKDDELSVTLVPESELAKYKKASENKQDQERAEQEPVNFTITDEFIMDATLAGGEVDFLRVTAQLDSYRLHVTNPARLAEIPASSFNFDYTDVKDFSFLPKDRKLSLTVGYGWVPIDVASLKELQIDKLHIAHLDNNSARKLEGSNIESLTIKWSEQLTSSDFLHKINNLHSLFISNSGIQEIDLSFMGKKIGGIDLQSAKINPNFIPDAEIDNLTLTGGKVDDEFVKRLPEAKSIKFLNLSYNPISDLSPLAKVNNLEFLQVESVDATDFSAFSKENVSLARLTVRGFASVPPDYSTMKGLRVVLLRIESATDDDVLEVSKSGILATWLDFGGDAVSNVDPVGHMLNIDTLNLTDTSVKKIGGKLLERYNSGSIRITPPTEGGHFDKETGLYIP